MQIPPAGPPRDPPGVSVTGSVARRQAERGNPVASGQAAASSGTQALTEQGHALTVVAQFFIDQDTKRLMVRIYDPRTGETHIAPPAEAAHLLPDTVKPATVWPLDRIV